MVCADGNPSVATESDMRRTPGAISTVGVFPKARLPGRVPSGVERDDKFGLDLKAL